MPIFAHPTGKEEVNASLQSPRACTRVLHPFWMPSLKRSAFALTFFVVFCHVLSIGGHGDGYNQKMVEAHMLLGAR